MKKQTKEKLPETKEPKPAPALELTESVKNNDGGYIWVV